AAAGDDDLDVLANEVGGQVREASVIALGIAVLDHQIAALGVPSLFEAMANIGELFCVREREPQQPDAARLLRAGTRRQDERSGGDCAQKIPAFHPCRFPCPALGPLAASHYSMTSSARSSTVCGIVRPSALGIQV